MKLLPVILACCLVLTYILGGSVLQAVVMMGFSGAVFMTGRVIKG